MSLQQQQPQENPSLSSLSSSLSPSDDADDHHHHNNKKNDCRPPKGKTYLTIGQDLFSIQEYLSSQYNASLHSSSPSPLSSFTPAAVMVYTSLASIDNGTIYPTDYGSGVEYAKGLTDDLFRGQNVGLQIGLWLDGTRGCRDILSGERDYDIQKLSHFLRDSSASAIFLRLGYEFDNPAFGYTPSPTLYQRAFRYLATRLNSPRVFFVWHSWGNSPTMLEDYYPGDDYVDWIGVSIFNQFDDDGDLSPATRVLEFARLRGKPTMIAESSPWGGIRLADPLGWYQSVLELIATYDVSLWSYINCDWESQPLWRGVGFGDSRLSSNEIVFDMWRREVLENERFLTGGSLRWCGGGEGGRGGEEVMVLGVSRQEPQSGGMAVVLVIVAIVVMGMGWKFRIKEELRGRVVAMGCCDGEEWGDDYEGRGSRRCAEGYDFETIPFTRQETEHVMGLGEGQIILSRYQNCFNKQDQRPLGMMTLSQSSSLSSSMRYVF